MLKITRQTAVLGVTLPLAAVTAAAILARHHRAHARTSGPLDLTASITGLTPAAPAPPHTEPRPIVEVDPEVDPEADLGNPGLDFSDWPDDRQAWLREQRRLRKPLRRPRNTVSNP